MKPLFYLLLPLLSFTAAAQNLNLGDSLRPVYKNINNPYFVKSPKVTTWAEGSDLLMIGDRSSDQLFLALSDTTLIGVLNRTEPTSFLFDTDGTSVLSQKTDIFLLPMWVVKNRTKISVSDTTILSVLNETYQVVLQADDLHPHEETIRKLKQFETDTTLANRHIALLFDNYQTIITETAIKGQSPPGDICVQLMNTLAYECYELFGRIPVIVYIYGGEALHSAGLIDEATAHFKKALKFYPDSIPLQVYNYRFEKNKNKQRALLARLKKEHPTHWMVKDL